MALKDIVLKLVIDGKESLVTLDKLDNKTLGIGKTVKNLAGAMGLAFGSAQVINFMKDSVALVQRENEVIGKLNATLKSTNYSAGLMSDELIDLANNLEELTNYKFDDKDIINAEGLLLTFKSINKEIFPEAMKLALDLSVRFEQDLTTSVKQLGKALEDPEKGITALRKAGVMFTDQQVELIKSLLKENDLLSAQKLILGELSTQVSGSAAASVDEYTKKINRLNEALEDVQKVLGDIVTGAGIGMLDYLEGLFKTGSIQGAMMYLKTKQQQSGWKPSTQADFLQEARSRAGEEIKGKSDADIRKLIDHNRAMYNASFMGFNEFGVPIDPESNLAMLNAKLAVYQSSLIKADKNVTDEKKKNVYDYAQYTQDLEDINNRNRLDFEEELNKARQESLDDLPILGDYSKTMAGSGESAGIFQQINFHLSATDVLLSSIRDGFNSAGDAAVGAMSQSIKVFSKANSVLQVFINSLVQATIQALVLKAVASMIGFIFGGPVGMATAVAATPMANGGIVTKPTLSVIGESGPEAVVPLNRYNDMRDRPINITLAGELNVGLNDLRVRLLRVEESINKYK